MAGRGTERDGPASARDGDVRGRSRDDDVAHLLMALVLGAVVGAWVGLMVWSYFLPDPQPGGPGDLEADVDALTAQIDLVAEDLMEVQRQIAASEDARDGLEDDLVSIQMNLALLEWRTWEAARSAERLETGATIASAELDELLGRLAGARAELVALLDGLAELLARMGLPAGGGGGGGTGLPANATWLPQPHMIHYTTPFLNFSCAICHNIEPSGETIVRGGNLYFNGSLGPQGFNTTVNRTQECTECHGQFPTNGMKPSYMEMSCTACHEEWADAMTATYVDETAIAEDDCLLCHGGGDAFITEPQGYG